MLILVCAKYYVLVTKNVGDMTKFSELPEQPSYKAVTQHFLEKSFKKLLMKTKRRKIRKTQKIVFFLNVCCV